MTKTEWMDIANPHQYSERGMIDGLEDGYNDAHIAYENGFVAGQKKLLEYLTLHCDKDEWTNEDKEDCIKIRTLKLMLKQRNEFIIDKSIAEADGGQLIDRGSFAKYVDDTDLGASINGVGRRIIAETIATRDKEWIAWLEQEYIVGEEQHEHADGDYIAIPISYLEERKKEIGL